MAFLDGIGKKLSQTGQDVVKKTRNFADSTKYSGMIADEEKAIGELFFQIGQTYYSLHRENPEAALTDLVGQVNGTYDRIEQYQEQINLLNGGRKCPRCGAVVPDNGIFCTACGGRFQEQLQVNCQPEENPAEHFCPACGVRLGAGMAFCTNCGAAQERVE